MKKSINNSTDSSDKKVCFENSPQVVEYDKLSSEDEYSLRNSNSQQSVDSGNSASKFATNFQLNWKPNLSNRASLDNATDPAVKHSQHPKPLPPMPQNLPQSDSLQQNLNFYNNHNNINHNTSFTGLNSNRSIEPEYDSSLKDSEDNGNISDLYASQPIEIPKLRTKKPPKQTVSYQYDKSDQYDESDQPMEIGEQLQDLKINDGDSVVHHKNSNNNNIITNANNNNNNANFSIGDYINNSKSSVNRFNFNSSSPTSPSKMESKNQKYALNFEDTLDSVLPPDRTPSKIIRENHRLYNKYKNNTNRKVSDNSDSYYDDVVLDTVRQNVDNAFSKNRNSVKQLDFGKIEEHEQEQISLNGSLEESKDEFTIGDYLNDSKHATINNTESPVIAGTGAEAEQEITDHSSSSNHSAQKESSTTDEHRAFNMHEHSSRVSSLGSSVPLGESTMDHSGIYISHVPNPDFHKIEEESEEHPISTDDHQSVENMEIAEQSQEEILEEHEDNDDQKIEEEYQKDNPEQSEIVEDGERDASISHNNSQVQNQSQNQSIEQQNISANSYDQIRGQDISIRQDDSDAFKPFADSVFDDQKSTANNTNEAINASNDSNASNFTLRLMQMKKEKEREANLKSNSDLIFGDSKPKGLETIPDFSPVGNKRSRDEDINNVNNNDNTPKSLAPTRLTNSILNDLLSKTNEYAARSGISVPPLAINSADASANNITTSDAGTPNTKTKIFSNKHSFDRPNKQIFDKPQFPRSPTQDSLSSSEDVHNIWANIGKSKEANSNNNNNNHQKATTIRSQSMKSSPSMNSVEIKKMLKTKRKISRGSSKHGRNSNKYGLPPPLPAQYKLHKDNQRAINDSLNLSTSTVNNRVGANFINDTFDRGVSDYDNDNDNDNDEDEDIEDDDDDVEIHNDNDDDDADMNNDNQYNNTDAADDTNDDIPEHIADELSKIPQPLLPEQHFDNFNDFEQEITQELSKYEDDTRGYHATIHNNELIVAKLENQDYAHDDSIISETEKAKIFVSERVASSSSNGNSNANNLPNEIFNSKKQHVYSGIVNKPGRKEVRSSTASNYGRRNRKVSGDSGTSSYTSARNSFNGKEINVRKRKSGALKDKIAAQEAERIAILNGNTQSSNGHVHHYRISSGGSHRTASIYERQISAPKSHRISNATKRGHSLRGSIHDVSSINNSMYNEKDRQHQQHPEPILEDENNYFDVNLPKDDQGRLYVRIVGLKNLDLPAIENHHAKFSLILDNGIHCISTPEVDLDTNTSINQEFELTVSDNLEFILTLKASYEYEGQEKLIEITEKYPVRKRVLGGLLGHKTIYKTRQKVVSKIDKTDPWDTKMAKDGSFARAYVDFAQYEPLITGKACNFDVTCFNEWETFVENGQVKKRQPYRIGKLELQMLYIPRTKVNEVFPPSIHIAYEAVKEYQKQLFVHYEGYLSQEGGDCNYLKRRWFTLSGTDMIAHNEFSKKTRAKINLIKAVGLISANIKKHYQVHPGLVSGRRLSDEIIMHQGFKIKFMNGEIIEFVADSHTEKMNWLRVLDQVISKNKFRQAWIKILYDQLN